MLKKNIYFGKGKTRWISLLPLFLRGGNLITKNYIYRIKYGGTKVKLKGGLAFLSIFRFSLEEYFLSKINFKGKTIYDIGSHIGILTIFFAKHSGKTGKVISFEPNPETYIRIQKNVKLNNLDNVKILNIGIGDKKEMKTLVFSPWKTGCGSMAKNIQRQIHKKKNSKILHIEVDTLDGCIEKHNLSKPDFIKIDIEGMEYNALLGAIETISKYNPSLYIEVHGIDEKDKIENALKIIKFLESQKYSVYHIESETIITESNVHIAKEGHIFCKKLAKNI